ncbi:MAG: hypothetical protein E7548_02410 [Ruminococcaceae bacterium]|nr:hypothetical protein [Oscillospiraceae bacterium]
MWGINIAEQTVSFFISLALGGFFCLFYDLFRAARKVHSFKPFLVFVSDILFFTVCAVITFCFLLSLTEGFIRGYFIFGILLGFSAVFFSISRFFLKGVTAVFRAIITLKRRIKNFCGRKKAKIRKIFKNKREKRLKKA